MNRRSFFRSVSSAVVGVYLGCHVKPIDDPSTLTIEELAPHTHQFNVNTAWVDAPYEIVFVAGNKWAFDRGQFPEFPEAIPDRLRIDHPIRMGSNGEIIPKFTYTI